MPCPAVLSGARRNPGGLPARPAAKEADPPYPWPQPDGATQQVHQALVAQHPGHRGRAHHLFCHIHVPKHDPCRVSGRQE
eukprot:scaffold183650_cov17-Tisochrysis_lutea.AAC.2